MKIFGQAAKEYPLLRDAVHSFFQSLHEIIPANTFFVAENRGGAYRILNAWNTGERLVRERDSLNLPVSGALEAYKFLGIPIMLRDGRNFGCIGAFDRAYAFTREDRKMMEWMAGMIGRLIEVEEDTIYDDLTGVYRRKYAEAMFYNIPIDERKAVVFVELNDFKEINDAFGYEAGDEVLKQIGSMLRDSACGDDMLACRYAGVEFLLIATGEAVDTLTETVGRLLQCLSRPLEIGGQTIPISASAGICFEAGSLQEYIQRAILSKQRGKRMGRTG